MAQRQNQQDKPAAEVTQEPAAVGATDAPDVNVKGAKLAHEDKQLAGGRTDGHILTGEPPADADKSSYPGPGDAKSEQPPVRTTRPDVGIAVSMSTGAGEHVPPDPDEYDAQGRLRDS